MGQGFTRVLRKSYTDGPTLTAAARASCVPTYFPFPLIGGILEIGSILRLSMHGRISCAVTTPGTARFDVSLGGTAIADTLAIPLNIVVQTTIPWWLVMLMTVRAVGNGSTANIFPGGYWLSTAGLNVAAPATGPGPGGYAIPYNTAPVVGAGFNSTIDNALDVNFTQTVATGSLTVHQAVLELVD